MAEATRPKPFEEEEGEVDPQFDVVEVGEDIYHSYTAAHGTFDDIVFDDDDEDEEV